ncbi:MAG: hypothetical protein V3R82_06100 [Candidatus Hydrothermarchaeales archaeon]
MGVEQSARRVFTYAAEKRVEDYTEPNYKPKEKALETTATRILKQEDIEGLEKVYTDNKVTIYKLKE